MKNKQKTEKNYLATECDRVGEIAVHYGFTVVTPPHVSSKDIVEAKIFKDFDHYQDAEEKVSLMHWYSEELQGQSHPVMIQYKKTHGGIGQKKNSQEEVYGFEIIGNARAESEAVLLKVAVAVLRDLGYTTIAIDINSVGDKESIVKFERELNNYYRKNTTLLPTKARQEFKKNHHSVLMDQSKDTEEFRNGAPQTIGTLNDQSRLHFKEVLEYMEAFGEAYAIRPSLLSNKLFASHTTFEIHDTSPSTKKSEAYIPLAYGYRYNYLTKKIGGKKDIPSIGITLIIPKIRIPKKKIILKNIKKPKFYLVQLGNTAKLKALNVVEMLRREKIPVYHSVTKDKITGQLSGAEYMKATHVLIIGQKEAIENSIVVRHITSREQETVPLTELADFLKRLK